MDSTNEVDHRGLSAQQRRAIASIGGLTGWANTTDRTRRMQTPREASPAEVLWHAKRLGFDVDNLTKDQLAQAESARKLYFARLAYKSAAARRKKA
ncbi:hypothetical protein ACEWX3_07520 [Mycobacterium sp. G7A2]|uniref:hypothetical protein n=1 Tax=Mycobacterium sp. G7A2 TaxID=3317307 RepID=UPI0035A92DD3